MWAAACAKARIGRKLPASAMCYVRTQRIDDRFLLGVGDRAAFLPSELRPQLVFLPLSETRVFSGFPQVQSIRLRRLFQPRRTEFRG